MLSAYGKRAIAELNIDPEAAEKLAQQYVAECKAVGLPPECSAVELHLPDCVISLRRPSPKEELEKWGKYAKN